MYCHYSVYSVVKCITGSFNGLLIISVGKERADFVVSVLKGFVFFLSAIVNVILARSRPFICIVTFFQLKHIVL